MSNQLNTKKTPKSLNTQQFTQKKAFGGFTNKMAKSIIKYHSRLIMEGKDKKRGLRRLIRLVKEDGKDV